MRRARWILGGALLAAVCFGMARLASEAARAASEFNAERWRAATARERYRMAGDLCRGGALLGKTREEVVEMLGKPDRDYESSVWYDCALASFLCDWTEWVCIDFDRDSGRVKEVGLRD
jgi:hypothetical protein